MSCRYEATILFIPLLAHSYWSRMFNRVTILKWRGEISVDYI